jgi:outer membrane protein
VAQAWYGLWLARETEVLAAQAVGSAEGHLELARRQVEAGAMPRRVLLQAELGLAQVRRQLSQAQEARIGAELALGRLTGLSGSPEPVEPPALAGPGSLDAALSVARSQRPDLQAAQARASAQRAALQARKAGWLPSLDGRFTYAYSENKGFSDDTTTWMLVAQANWLLWDGGMRVAQSRLEQSRLRSAELLMEDGWAQAEQEVHTAWEQRERAELSLRAAESELRLAEENLRLAEVGLSAGGATWLDVQDARVSLGAARSAGLQERARADLAVIALLLATGGL